MERLSDSWDDDPVSVIGFCVCAFLNSVTIALFVLSLFGF